MIEYNLLAVDNISVAANFQSILVGESKVVLTGGAENMSPSSFRRKECSFRYKALGQKYEFEDMLWLGMMDTHCNVPMGMTAEILGAKYGLKREEVDEFALRSQQLWKAGKHLATGKDSAPHESLMTDRCSQ